MSGRRRPARELRATEDGPPLLFPLSLFCLSHLETAGAARGVRWPASGQRHGGACALVGGLRATTRKRKEKWPGERKRRAPTPSPPSSSLSREKKKRVGRFARARLGGSPHAHTQPRSPRRARRAPAAGPAGPLCAWTGARTGAGAAISVRTHTEGKKMSSDSGSPRAPKPGPPKGFMFGNIEERTHRLEADYIDEVRRENGRVRCAPSIGHCARPLASLLLLLTALPAPRTRPPPHPGRQSQPGHRGSPDAGHGDRDSGRHRRWRGPTRPHRPAARSGRARPGRSRLLGRARDGGRPGRRGGGRERGVAVSTVERQSGVHGGAGRGSCVLSLSFPSPPRP